MRGRAGRHRGGAGEWPAGAAARDRRLERAGVHVPGCRRLRAGGPHHGRTDRSNERSPRTWCSGWTDDPRWAGVRGSTGRRRGRRTAELIENSASARPAPTRRGRSPGGNQQKVVLARALERRPAVLVAENPTRGLDVRATGEMHAAAPRRRGPGVAVMVYSTDLDEVLELAAARAGGPRGAGAGSADRGGPAGGRRDDAGTDGVSGER